MSWDPAPDQYWSKLLRGPQHWRHSQLMLQSFPVLVSPWPQASFISDLNGFDKYPLVISHSYRTSPFSMGQLSISMAMLNSDVSNFQRVVFQNPVIPFILGSSSYGLPVHGSLSPVYLIVTVPTWWSNQSFEELSSTHPNIPDRPVNVAILVKSHGFPDI